VHFPHLNSHHAREISRSCHRLRNADAYRIRAVDISKNIMILLVPAGILSRFASLKRFAPVTRQIDGYSVTVGFPLFSLPVVELAPRDA
jgi:hypothetical protein